MNERESLEQGMRVTAIIVAAGNGTRFGGTRPKQYEDLAGEPVIRRTMNRFIGHPAISEVLAVISPGHQDYYLEACGDLEAASPVDGGADRQSSVFAGLQALGDNPPSHVLVHDAARPLVSDLVISHVIDGLLRNDAVLPVIAVADSLKRSENGRVTQALEREGVVIAQTPQGFAYSSICQAHEAHLGQSMSDDTAVAASFGLAIATVPGAVENLKLTTPGDMKRALAYLGAASMRVVCGTGFDVHSFADDRPLILCGCDIPHERGLAGHSDADVGLHAITDAIFGALADGDIGSHFPPSDAQWKDASSDQFLLHAVNLVRARGGEINHLDLTLICEQPKIGPHRDRMRQKISDIAGLAIDRISVKATTTERLGFTGRGEGIAAQAIATLEWPT